MGRPLSDLAALVTPVDDALLAQWRTLGLRTDETIGYILENSARTWPDRVAVITATRSLTFGDLQREASAVARTLVDRGVRSGDVVCWMLPTDAEAIVVESAIWRIGAVSSPIVPLYREREITNVLEQLHPAAIITNAQINRRAMPDEFDEVLEKIGLKPLARLLCTGSSPGWDRATSSGHGALPDSVVPSAASDPCLVLFTSGTESLPKGAVHTAAGITHELRSIITGWGVTFRDRMFMASPMTHITGLLQGFLIPSRVGAAAVLMDRWNADEALELIEATGATYMAGATPFLRELTAAYRASGLERSSLIQYCCGGAAVPPELIREVQELGVSAYRAWGMTELPTSTIPNELVPLEYRAETDGKLAPGVELRVLDDNGDDLGPDQDGRLLLRGPEMMLGYVQAELNEKAFLPGGWFDTGDVGQLGSDGYVRISGRSKDIINRGGEKFSSREIEELISHHPDVSAVAVVPIPGGRLGEQIGVALVSRRPDLSIQEIGEFITSRGMAKHKQPEQLITVSSIPTNATGKVDKKAIVSLFETERKA